MTALQEEQQFPPEMPCPHTRRAVQEIDAAMFSGDTFFDADARAHLAFYLERWTRTLIGIDEMLEENLLCDDGETPV